MSGRVRIWSQIDKLRATVVPSSLTIWAKSFKPVALPFPVGNFFSFWTLQWQFYSGLYSCIQLFPFSCGIKKNCQVSAGQSSLKMNLSLVRCFHVSLWSIAVYNSHEAMQYLPVAAVYTFHVKKKKKIWNPSYSLCVTTKKSKLSHFRQRS